MANKEKLLANAQKFISKGQIPKAIDEYRKLVDAFPKDVRNRQKLAELLSRDNKNEAALTEYEVVAKHYTDTGFYLKAIALFKQMQKVDPSRVDLYHRLAELNEKQGLVGNALTEYRSLVSFYEKNQMYREAIDVLEKMSELDPGNLNFTAKIAECYKASGQNDEALERFLEIVEPLSEKGEHLKVVKLYERFLDICPEEGSSRIPLVRAFTNTGSADKAIQVIKGLLKQSPEDTVINRCLTDAYVANQDFANARLTLKHLLKLTGDDLDLREYYVRICIDAGETERARDRLEEWKDGFFQAERVAVLKAFYEELKALRAGDTVVTDTLAVIYEAVGDNSKLGALETPSQVDITTEETADSALLDEAIDDVETLEMVGEDAPDDIEVPSLDIAEDLPAEKIAAVGVELDLDLDLDLDLGVSGLEDEEPVATVEDNTENSSEAGSVPGLEDDAEVEVELDLDDMGDLDLEFEEEIAFEEEVAEEEVAEEEVAEEEVAEEEVAEEEVAEEEVAEEEIAFGSDLEFDLETSESDEPAERTELSLDSDLEFASVEIHPRAESLESLEASEVAPIVEMEGSDELELLEELEVSEELEEIDELETLEELDTLEGVEELEVLDEIEELEDVDALEELEDIEELDVIEEIETLEELDVVEDVESLEEEEPLAAAGPAGKADFASALNVDAELEEAEFYLQQGLYDDAERVVQTLMGYLPGLPDLQAKMDEINLNRQSAEAASETTDFIDIMSDLRDDDLLAATDFLDSFGDNLVADDELSQKTVAELDSADTESHFNLGIAYKEMGLYDDAVAELEKASISPARVLDCITLIGQCYIESGDSDAAMNSFKTGLAHEGLSDEGRMTLNFEIGMLHQMNGQLLEALESFQLVAEKDSFFREVAELVKNLRRELGLDDKDDDDGPQGNRDRVSYV